MERNCAYPDAQFTDASHAFTYDNYSSGAEFYRYTVDATGTHLVDGTTLTGLGGFSGGFTIDAGIGFGAGGGIFNPFTTVPSMLGQVNLGSGPYATGLVGGGVVPYAAEKKAFYVAINDAGTWLVYVERCDIALFQCEEQIQLPTNNQVVEGAVGTRWGQDGLAYILNPGVGSGGASQILLLRGPFVLPAEASANSAPVLSSVGTGSVGVGTGNQRITVTGTGFLPGAGVMWNGVMHDTAYTDAQTLSVAVSAADVTTAGTISVTVRNPGSSDSNAVSVAVK